VKCDQKNLFNRRLKTIYGQKKTTKNNGEEKSTNTENQKHPPVPSITPLFNLLALCVQQIKSEISSDGMLVFFLLSSIQFQKYHFPFLEIDYT
jgi:hypothetical protein